MHPLWNSPYCTLLTLHNSPRRLTDSSHVVQYFQVPYGFRRFAILGLFCCQRWELLVVSHIFAGSTSSRSENSSLCMVMPEDVAERSMTFSLELLLRAKFVFVVVLLNAAD